MSDKVSHAKFAIGLLNNLRNGYVPVTFPDPSGYRGSPWDLWEKMIIKRHEEDMKTASSKCYSWNDAETEEEIEESNNLMRRYDDGIVNRLTETMYASLIVSIWASMDNLLKEIMRKVSCKLVEYDKSYRDFNDMIDFLKVFSINAETISDYDVINAIRILNNSFKHHNGRYTPEKAVHTQITKPLLDTWNIQPGVEITYSILPIKKLIFACNTFCSELLDLIRVHKNIKSQMEVVG